MKKLMWLMVGLSSTMTIAQADQNDVFDQAMKEAQRLKSQSQGLPKVPYTKNTDAVIDPEQIMKQYQSLGKSQKPNEDLIIFVSSSMPMAALEKLGRQAKSAGAVMVMRGLIGDLDKNGWNQTMEYIKPVAKTGASIQIHPDLFKQYNVTQVPTFVLATNGIVQGCNDDMCDANSIQAVGDASLDYVLEYWQSKYSNDKKIASLVSAKLKMIEQGKK